MEENLDELVKQLKSENKEVKKIQKENNPDINDSNINEYVIEKASKLVEGGVGTVEALKEAILTGCDAREIESFSELFKAVTGAVDTLNKINIQNKKSKTAKELKEIDNTQKQLEEPKSNNTNILIATREEIIRGFFDKNEKVINASVEEEHNENEEKEKNE